MPPRRATQRQPTQATQATQQATQRGDAGDEAGPSNRATFADYVTFTLIQSIMNEGCLPEADVKAMLHRLTDRNTDEALRQVLTKIQQDMSYLEMTIERIKFPVNQQWYICLVNKDGSDESAKLMGSRFNPDQMLYFRSVVDALGSAPGRQGSLLGELSSMALYNVDVGAEAAAADGGGSQAATAARRHKLGHDEKERLIRAFAQDGWLFQSRDGYFTLGPRTLGELKNLVLSTLPEDVAEQLQRDYM